MNKQWCTFYNAIGFFSWHRFANNSSRAMKNDLSEDDISFITCHLFAGNKKEVRLLMT